jgi:hypothetical protein
VSALIDLRGEACVFIWACCATMGADLVPLAQ